MFLFQWFNPFAWLIKDAVKNNLEYKTDHEIVKTNDPQMYQQAMVALADKKGVAPFLTALNGSQLKNRIIMMKKKTENKFTLLKQLIILPLLAILVMGLSNREVKTKFIQPGHQLNTSISGNNFPEYNIQSPASSVNENVKNGTDTVIESDQFLISMKLQQNQLILEGLEGCAFTELTFTITNDKPVAINQFGMASVGSGNSADDSGFLFEIEKNYDQIKLIGKTGTAWKGLTYKPAIQKHFISETGVSRVNNPLLVVDGVIDDNRSVDDFDPGELKSVSILKDEKAFKLYGEKGKNGVIVITSKKFAKKNKITSELELRKFIANNIKYPVEAMKNNIKGSVDLWAAVE